MALLSLAPAKGLAQKGKKKKGKKGVTEQVDAKKKAGIFFCSSPRALLRKAKN